MSFFPTTPWRIYVDRKAIKQDNAGQAVVILTPCGYQRQACEVAWTGEARIIAVPKAHKEDFPASVWIEVDPRAILTIDGDKVHPAGPHPVQTTDGRTV